MCVDARGVFFGVYYLRESLRNFRWPLIFLFYAIKRVLDFKV